MEPRLIKRTIDLLAEEWRTRGWRQRLMLTGAVLADKLELSVWCGDEPASLEGAAATAFFETEKLEVKKPCEITANTICVEFPAEAYVEGRLVVRIYIADTVRSIPLYMETFEVGQGHGTVVYDPENIVDITMVTALLASINQKLDKGGHAPNKYLGTDSDGNVVEKDAPSGGGGISVDLTGYATESWVSDRLGSYMNASELDGAIDKALAQAAASGEFDGVGIEGVTVTRSPDEFGYYYITVTLTDGQQQAFPYRNGVDGVSPVASVQQTSDGAIVTVVDKNGTTTATLKNGKDGESFTYEDFTPEQLATLKGDPGYTPVKGKDYFDGLPGTSVTVQSVNENQESGGTNVVTFSDGKKLNVKNGKDGEDGYTPVKGKDYSDGAPGSDANVTTANITKALGYTPANAATVSQLAAEIGVIPDYVETEAESVIERVLAAQGNRTLTIAAISDLHYASSYTDGILHACQALKYIDERVKLDAVTVLGDYTDGYTTRDLADALADYRAINALMGQLRFAPNLRQMGNHDYYENNIPITRRFVQMYSDDVVWGDRHGGYYYKDFDMFKARVICLNCNENNVMETDSSTGGVKPTGSISITAAQAQWFADMLADVNTKTDADEWQVLVLSHQPLDWYDSQTGYTLPKIVNAYHEGTSYSSSVVTCNYTGKNLAKLICNIHGHIHNFLVDYIHKDNVANGNKTKVWRMATPQACLNRANEYQGAWHEATTYEKTQNTAKDTSFVIYCIDLDTCTTRAICYGAGYDRTLVYHTETVVYNITQTLTNVTSSNTAINIAQGEAFTTTLTAQSGYELGTIKVTMGGTDVTASALSGSKITISSVTGDIVITATATLIQTGPAYTNQIPISVDTSGAVYNGTGYKDGYRLNSSGAEATLAGTAVTGYIPIKLNDVVRFKNINYYPGVNSVGNYIALYKPDFTSIASTKDGSMSNSLDYLFGDRVNDDTGKLIQFRIADGSQDFGYMRVSAVGLNADSIITINEEITD